MIIKNNFVQETNFKFMKQFLLSPEIDWHLNKVLYFDKKCDYHQLINIIYDQHTIVNEQHFNMLRPLIQLLPIRSMLRIKCNLLFKTSEIIEHGMHTDYTPAYPDSKTAIYYVNKNNGYTKLEDGTIINSEENKIAIINGDTKHTGTTCTDEEFRLVININYF